MFAARIGYILTAPLVDDSGTLPLIQLDPSWESLFAKHEMDMGDGAMDVALPPQEFNRRTSSVQDRLNNADATPRLRPQPIASVSCARRCSQGGGAIRCCSSRRSGIRCGLHCWVRREMEDLAAILETTVSSVLVWFGIFTRVAAIAFVLPGIGERAVPTRIKLGGALALSAIVAPLVISRIPDLSATPAMTVQVIIAEAFVGLFIGIAIRLLVFVVQIAGTVAAQSLAVSQMFGGVASTEPEPIIATFLSLAVITLALSAGLHVQVIMALSASYNVAPFGLALPAEDVGRWAAESGRAAFDMAIGLALPFIILSFIYNLSLGAINRAMPQLMVAFIGAPAITLMGIGLLLLSTPIILRVWLDTFRMVMLNPFEVMP